MVIYLKSLLLEWKLVFQLENVTFFCFINKFYSDDGKKKTTRSTEYTYYNEMKALDLRCKWQYYV